MEHKGSASWEKNFLSGFPWPPRPQVFSASHSLARKAGDTVTSTEVFSRNRLLNWGLSSHSAGRLRAGVLTSGCTSWAGTGSSHCCCPVTWKSSPAPRFSWHGYSTRSTNTKSRMDQSMQIYECLLAATPRLSSRFVACVHTILTLMIQMQRQSKESCFKRKSLPHGSLTKKTKLFLKQFSLESAAEVFTLASSATISPMSSRPPKIASNIYWQTERFRTHNAVLEFKRRRLHFGILNYPLTNVLMEKKTCKQKAFEPTMPSWRSDAEVFTSASSTTVSPMSSWKKDLQTESFRTHNAVLKVWRRSLHLGLLDYRLTNVLMEKKTCKQKAFEPTMPSWRSDAEVFTSASSTTVSPMSSWKTRQHLACKRRAFEPTMPSWCSDAEAFTLASTATVLPMSSWQTMDFKQQSGCTCEAWEAAPPPPPPPPPPPGRDVVNSHALLGNHTQGRGEHTRTPPQAGTWWTHTHPWATTPRDVENTHAPLTTNNQPTTSSAPHVPATPAAVESWLSSASCTMLSRSRHSTHQTSPKHLSELPVLLDWPLRWCEHHVFP